MADSRAQPDNAQPEGKQVETGGQIGCGYSETRKAGETDRRIKSGAPGLKPALLSVLR